MQSWQPLAIVILATLVLASLKVEAADGATVVQPTLEVLGSHSTEGVRLALAQAELKHVLRLQSTTAVPVGALRVIVTPLRDGAGQMWDVAWDLDGKGAETQVPVPAFGSVPLTLNVRLPAIGMYTGDLFLLHGATPQRVRIAVTRGPTPLPVEVLGLAPVADTAWPIGTSEARLRFTVQETSGEEVSLIPATVVALSRVAKDTLQFQAPFTLKDAAPFTLKGGESRTVQLVLAGLDGAGEYRGTLRLSGPGAQPVDREFRVFLKEHWSMALLWISVGVAASLLLRKWVQHFRPRLDAQHALLLIRQELERESEAVQPLDEMERRVLEFVRGEVERMVAQVGSGALKPAAVQAEQTRLLRKRELFQIWMMGRRQVRELQPAKVREHFDKPLDDAKALLMRTGATLEDLSSSRAMLEKIPGDVEAAMKHELKDAIASLAKEVEDSHAFLGEQFVREVVPDLAAARKAFERDIANGSGEARALFERARRTYLELLAQQLAAQLSATPPLGFTPPAWEELKKSVMGMLADAHDRASGLEVAFASYEQAHRNFLTRAVRALLDALPGLAKDVDKDTELGTQQKESLKARLNAQQTGLEDVLKDARAGHLREAAAKYAEMSDTLMELTSRVKVRGNNNKMSPLAVGGTAALAQPLFWVSPGTTFAPVSTQSVRLEKVAWRRDWIDVVVSVFLAVVAGLLGVMALWVHDLTWGGWTACVTAFLWGMGLHQATFSALSGLAETIVGAKDPT
ncbi:hypothetical protein MYSTI_01866 [Myxococcus stipitatus DSM 14675]|uniref:Uncharacterized protein n=1 Tax=Myxococcus stipitatus (strain DSM 14675 / JCM 12634 / Mx s8) TaxID=1278073 RepID=L7U4X2_MYXSD|nr:hypothetical protein [Myxococcus stipitatus]AGC43198.1 hypothetical protein MYSTI_01866 [Myxococcus stipitatus DSM 14675]